MDESSLQVLLGRGVSVEEIGRRFGRDPSTVAYWMRKYGLETPRREKHAAKGGIPRERLEALVAEGRSIAEIAEAVKLSKATVRYWLRKYGLRTAGDRRSRHAARSRALEISEIERECSRHGTTVFIMEGRGYYRCKRCRAERVAARRRSLKATLVAEAGGRCILCGYSRCAAALEFHHLDPDEKRFALAAGGLSHSLARLRTEIERCVLLCSNCHAEVESGVAEIALK